MRLGDAALKIGSGATPRGGGSVYLPAGISFIRSQNVLNSGFFADGLAHIGDEHALQLEGVSVRPGDVLLNLTGDSVGRCCLAPPNILPARVNQHVAIVRPKPDVLDPVFLRYVLVSSAMQARLLALAHAGATRPALTKSMIEELEIPAPNLADQRRLAGTIAAVEAKIDHNSRLRSELDQAAVSFFGHFSSKVTRRTPLRNRVTLLKRSVKPASFPNEVFRHFSIPSFDIGERPVMEPGAAMLSAKTLLEETDVILLSKLNPVTPRVWWPTSDQMHRSVCSPEFLVLEPQAGCPRAFIYSSLRFDQTLYDEILSHATGTTGSRQRARADDVLACQILDPTSQQLEEMDGVLGPLMSLRASLLDEDSELVDLRSSLIDDLIEGRRIVRPGFDPSPVLSYFTTEAA